MKKKEAKKENEIAYIQIIVDDQEIEGSYCSKCGCLLNKYLDERFNQVARQLKWYVESKKRGKKPEIKELRCPKCESILKLGKIYVPIDSSDH